jgi:hypothetical protein
MSSSLRRLRFGDDVGKNLKKPERSAGWLSRRSASADLKLGATAASQKVTPL